MIERSVAFKVQYRIDDVFEGFRTRDATVLGDVSDHEHRRARLLGEAHQSRGTLAHLSDITRSALEQFGVDSLDGVDDERVDAFTTSADLRCRGENRFE